MSTKREKARDPDGGAARDTDTAAYAQTSGTARNGADNARQSRMPHERDESASATGNRLGQDVPPSKNRISQAAEDAESGQRDTDRRGVPNDIPAGRKPKS